VTPLAADTRANGYRPMLEQKLTASQRVMVDMWERHMAAEFDAKSVDATMATMTAEPVVNHVPVMTGGLGAHEVRHFYASYFLHRHPPDTAIVPLARTVGHDRIVDEIIYQFTHSIDMPWMLPGVAPTGRHVEVALVVVVEFVDGRISGERIYWDQASVLAQAARKTMEPARERSNTLILRAKKSRV
jgi:carboxymethylenebutenolidase